MSAVPERFEERREIGSDCSENDDGQSSFWVLFAVGVLLFCWIAEATMCAERGF